MDWQERIHTDPEILSGKPGIKGTRLAVEFLVERLKYGWTEQMIFESYPRITPEDLDAAVKYYNKFMK